MVILSLYWGNLGVKWRNGVAYKSKNAKIEIGLNPPLKTGLRIDPAKRGKQVRKISKHPKSINKYPKDVKSPKNQFKHKN